jgi:transposase
MNYLKFFKFLTKSKRKRKKILQLIAQRSSEIVGKQKKGRPRASMQLMVAGILYYLKSGCTWEMLPNEFGPHQTVYGWYVRLCEEKAFQQLFQELKMSFHSKKKIERLCTDGSLAQHCRKNELTSINPRNKNKFTLNRFMTTDGDGLPLDILITNGSAHDSIFFMTSIYNAQENIELEYNWSSHADKGFDSKQIRKFIKSIGGIPIIPYRNLGKNRGVINKKDSKRFVVERTFAWINSCKNLKIIFIKKSNRIKEMMLLFSSIIYLRRFSESDIANLMIGSAY